MPYCTVDRVRDMTGLTEDEIGDQPLQIELAKAEKRVLRDLTIKRSNIDLTQSSDDSTLYSFPHSPIADIDRDSEVTIDDITVYEWTDSNDSSTKSEVTVTFIDAQSGQVKLSNFDSANRITGDYSYYLGNVLPDWDILEEAVAWMTGYLAINKIRGKVPSKYNIGDLRIDDSDPGSNLRHEYRRVIRELKVQMAT